MERIFMHGFVFLKLKDYAEHECGIGWDSLVTDAGLEAGEHAFDRSYEDQDFDRLVTALAGKAGRPEAYVLESFGMFLTPELFEIARFMDLVQEDWGTLDLLEHLKRAVHGTLHSADPLFEPPPLEAVRTKDDEILVFYHSPRKLCPLLKGIIKGAADHYGETIGVKDDRCVENGDSGCQLTVTLQAAKGKKASALKALGKLKNQPLQAFNIYKGVPVTGSATLSGVSGDTVTLNVSRYQAIAMKIAGETFLQSPAFSKDIRAVVKSVNTSKGEAKLHHFTYIDSEIGKRQLVRVSPESPVEAVLRFKDREFEVELANLSLEGVAVRLPEAIEINEHLDFNPRVSFRLPVRKSAGETSVEELELAGTVCGVYEDKSKHFLRMYFGETGPQLMSLIRRYIAQRQMEIVREFHYYI
jgi:hypothetical protein